MTKRKARPKLQRKQFTDITEASDCGRTSDCGSTHAPSVPHTIRSRSYLTMLSNKWIRKCYDDVCVCERVCVCVATVLVRFLVQFPQCFGSSCAGLCQSTNFSPADKAQALKDRKQTSSTRATYKTVSLHSFNFLVLIY